MRLKDRVAIVVGAGQSPGEGMGNGRATALTFARDCWQVEGDRDIFGHNSCSTNCSLLGPRDG